jgi:hypothetical protein
VEDIGKMADLLPDQSILQIGTEGVHAGLHFAVIGRIQLQYDAGIWNEWHVLFDNMRSGWLSEAGGVFYMTFPRVMPSPIAAAEGPAIQIGQKFSLAGGNYSVVNIDQAKCIAGQGELPFKVGAGYDVLSIDLRDGNAIASLDFSQDPALLFVGEQVQLGKLKLSNTRSLADQQPSLPSRSVLPFSCPRCGAPITQYSDRSVSIICGSCHVIIDEESVASRAFKRTDISYKVEPKLALGTTGTLKSQSWTVIGFMLRMAGSVYRWEEYLLINDKAEFAWLVFSEGHWSFGQAVAGQPKVILNEPTWAGVSYEHYASFEAVVAYVLGEFYWRVNTGERVNCNDYIAPPYMLSRESTAKEDNWTLLEYIEPDTLNSVFKPPKKLSASDDVGCIQPNPHTDTHAAVFRRYAYCALLALAVQLLLVMFMPHGKISHKDLSFAPGNSEDKQLAQFELTRAARNVAISGRANVNNDWVALDFTLTEQKSGTEYRGQEEVSYYTGWEDGETWSEGDQKFRIYLGDLPAGNYLLTADAETDNHYVSATLDVEHGELSWLNFLLIESFLLIFPIITYRRVKRFEAERWLASDHPEKAASLLDSDDDD